MLRLVLGIFIWAQVFLNPHIIVSTLKIWSINGFIENVSSMSLLHEDYLEADLDGGPRKRT